MDENNESSPHLYTTLSDLDSFELATSPDGYYMAARKSAQQENDESQAASFQPKTPGLNRQILTTEIPESDVATPSIVETTQNSLESPVTQTKNNQLDLINEELNEIRELIVFDTNVPLDNLNAWMKGLLEMGNDPKSALLALELLIALKFQIKQKKLGKPFINPFNRDEFLRGCVNVGRQAMASSPLSPQTQLQIKLEKQKRMLAKEDAMYMEPHKFYQKMPKPKQGFFVYGACFGKPQY